MCGIGGIIYKKKTNIHLYNDIEFLLNSIRKRGPDGNGIWISDIHKSILCHSRLSIIDLSIQASQPFISIKKDKIIVFNGEIYNFKILRDKLIEKKIEFKSNSDTEVLLNVYEEFGISGLSLLRGMYAFAIYDSIKNEILIARDGYGIKPLYYYNDDEKFIFSSYAKSFAKLSDNKKLSVGNIQALMFGSSCDEITSNPNVMALESGTFKIISNELNITNSILQNSQKIILNEEEDRIKKIGRLIDESVKFHMVSDVPIGIMLSSGIDSCILASSTHNLNKSKIHAFTIVFEKFKNTNYDEIKLASEICNKFGFEHITEVITDEDLEKSLPQILDDMDQLTADGINTWFVARLAKRKNIKVLLSGVGGDELLGGYKSFNIVPYLYMFRKFFNILSIIIIKLLDQLIKLKTLFKIKKFSNVFYRLKLLFIMKPSIINAYLVKRIIFTPYELEILLNKPSDEILSILEKYSYEINEKYKIYRNKKFKYDIFFLESQHYLKNQLLRDSDWAGMSHGVEIRTPYCDIFLRDNLNSLINNLNERKKLKYILAKKYFQLPSNILSKRKTGFKTYIPLKFVNEILEKKFDTKYLELLTDYQKTTLALCTPECRIK